MAKAKAITKRRKAVTNIRKITRTMQLIATAKFQKSMNRSVTSRRYADCMDGLVAEIRRAAPHARHPLLETNAGVGRAGVLVITSSRGLCGGYNARILEAALTRVRQLEAEGAVALDVSGKKGLAYFKFLGRSVGEGYTQFDDHVRFHDVRALADRFIAQYVRRELEAVYVVYMRCVSTARQVPEVLQLLPVRLPESAGDGPAPAASPGVEYDFSPEPAQLLGDLLPASVRVQLFQCFTDAAVSEQIARMVAMKAATDAASDMIKILTRTYNRARQAQITLELLDIMGGAEALGKRA